MSFMAVKGYLERRFAKVINMDPHSRSIGHKGYNIQVVVADRARKGFDGADAET